MVYSRLFAAVYTQIRVDAHLRNLLLSQPDGGQTDPSYRLRVLQTSQQLREEGSRVLYGENLFRFHLGSANFNTTFMAQRTIDLMQNIEISLWPSKPRESIRILQFFSGPQISRKSCVIKLKFREVQLMKMVIIRALKRLTGFNVLTFEVEAPNLIRHRLSGAPTPRVSCLLAHMKDQLTQTLGPSTFINSDDYRRLVFHPQDLGPVKI